MWGDTAPGDPTFPPKAIPVGRSRGNNDIQQVQGSLAGHGPFGSAMKGRHILSRPIDVRPAAPIQIPAIGATTNHALRHEGLPCSPPLTT